MTNLSSSLQLVTDSPSWNPPGKEVVNEISREFLEWYRTKRAQVTSTPSKTMPNMPVPATLMSQAKVLEELAKLRLTCDAGGDKCKRLLRSGSSNTTLAGDFGNERHVIEHQDKMKTPRESTWRQIGRAAQILQDYCENKVFRTLRSFYYVDKPTFVNQDKANALIHQIATQLNCTRSSLNVFPTDRGTIIGGVSFMVEEKLLVNCNEESENGIKCMLGKTIPPFLNLVSDIKVRDDIRFILFVEKYSAFVELAQHDFHNDYHCIIITGTGQADLVSKEFTKKLMDDNQLPAFCLCDCDASGIEIFSVIKYGSINVTYDSKRLACTGMYWLGIHPSDLEVLNIPSDLIDSIDEENEVEEADAEELNEECRAEAKKIKNVRMVSTRKGKRKQSGKKRTADTELAKLLSLAEKKFVKGDEKLRAEVSGILKWRKTAALEHLNALGIHCLSEFYVPYKLFGVMRHFMDNEKN